MAADWEETSLAKTTDLLTGFPFKSANYTEAPEGIALVRGDNVVQGQFRWDDVKRWPSSETNELSDYFLNAGDVVIAMDRPWIEAGLKYARASEEDLPCLLVQRVARLRARNSLDQQFLRYIIGSREFTNHILSIQTGTAVPHISANQILEFAFRLPSPREQRAIAQVLGSLDDKIELNRRMNETLESMARALFKSWFVDFDPVRAKAQGRDPGLPKPLADLFPDSFEDSELGEIPKGWEVRGLDEIARFLNGLALQKYPAGAGESLPVIKIAQIRAGHTAGADRASIDLPPDYVVDDGDVLFSWSGSLEVVLWASGRGALNQHLFKVTSGDFPKWFYYLWICRHLPNFRRIAAAKATTMGHIQRHHLSEAKVAVPPRDFIGAADQHFAPLIDVLPTLLVQSRSLGVLRDELLPKLVSGDVRVVNPAALIGKRV